LSKRSKVKWLNVKVAAVTANVRPVMAQEQILRVLELVKNAAALVIAQLARAPELNQKRFKE
jgi:hypothetical protein